MRKKTIRPAALMLAAIMAVSPSSVRGAEYTAEDAGEEVFYQSADSGTEEEPAADDLMSVQTAEGVTPEMCSYDYWNDKTKGSEIDPDKLLITKAEIATLNREILASKDANMYDLENMTGKYDADDIRNKLVAGTTPLKDTIYADEVPVDPKAYYKTVADAISETGYTDKSREYQYAVAVKRTTMNNIPVSAYIGYKAKDSDDEKVSAALLVGEPFVIGQRATVFGDDFYWGYSDNCSGWVSAEDLAVCRDRDEWLEAWKTDIDNDDFIVVTQNKITLEPSVSMPELSEVKLTFSTILKTVPDDLIPASLAERGPWNNHVVYLPGRDKDGRYVRRIALVSQHYEVSTGFLDMTQSEVLRVAFNNLGDRYGWGGAFDSMDCSMLTRNVYRCFGLNLPRNTTWQQALPGRKIDLSAMSDEEKVSAMKKMPAGTLFYLSGHTMIFTGIAKMDGADSAYVISDAGSLADTGGDLNVRSMYSVILNPLSVRRRAGTTWLANITAAVLPISDGYVDLVRKNINTEEPQPQPEPVHRVPAAEGQTYASTADTLPLETFLGNMQNIFISFYNADGFGSHELTATVLKGSKITTKMPVKAVRCDKATASTAINKNGLAVVTMKKSGIVTFDMADGKTYDVVFTVETPKSMSANVKKLISEAKERSEDALTLDIKTLFGCGLDGGTLAIVSQKDKSASVCDNKLTINPMIKNNIKISYTYLNKKYTMTIVCN